MPPRQGAIWGRLPRDAAFRQNSLTTSLLFACCVHQGLEFLLLGKSGQPDATDDEGLGLSRLSSSDECASGDANNCDRSKLLSRRTRPV